MLVVTFAVEGAGNCVTIDGVPYVYARTRHGECVQPARCPHRGGPLHLARLTGDQPLLTCPWHERRTRIFPGPGRAIASVRRGNQVTALFPHPAETRYEIGYRPLSPDLRSPCA